MLVKPQGQIKQEAASVEEAGAEKAESISKKAGPDKERRSASEKKIGKSGAAEKTEKIKAYPLSGPEIPAAEEAAEKAYNNRKSALLTENEKKSPDYESKASEYLDTLEKEAENSRYC